MRRGRVRSHLNATIAVVQIGSGGRADLGSNRRRGLTFGRGLGSPAPSDLPSRPDPGPPRSDLAVVGRRVRHRQAPARRDRPAPVWQRARTPPDRARDAAGGPAALVARPRHGRVFDFQAVIRTVARRLRTLDVACIRVRDAATESRAGCPCHARRPYDLCSADRVMHPALHARPADRVTHPARPADPPAGHPGCQCRHTPVPSRPSAGLRWPGSSPASLAAAAPVLTASPGASATRVSCEVVIRGICDVSSDTCVFRLSAGRLRHDALAAGVRLPERLHLGVRGRAGPEPRRCGGRRVRSRAVRARLRLHGRRGLGLLRLRPRLAADARPAGAAIHPGIGSGCAVRTGREAATQSGKRRHAHEPG